MMPKAYNVEVRKIYDDYRLTWENSCCVKFTRFFSTLDRLINFCQWQGIDLPKIGE